MAYKNNLQKPEAGFVLLITLIVVGVVLSVGLTMLDLSIKQVRLSSNAKESELAFHAANAGAECARFIRRNKSNDMLIGGQIDIECFGSTISNVSSLPVGSATVDGEAFQYEYEFTWGAEPRCTKINTVVASSTAGAAGMTILNMDTWIPSFPDDGTNSMFCDAGSRCTAISVRGYNRPCTTAGGYGTVEREVLIKF